LTTRFCPAGSEVPRGVTSVVAIPCSFLWLERVLARSML
jgi:hypothetical protein